MTATIGGTATLVHDYSMDDVDRYARVAAKRAWGRRSVDFDEVYEEAWSAVVERIYASDTRPTAVELIKAGADAINDLARHRKRDNGIGTDGEPMPQFHKYWRVMVDAEDGFTEKLVERMALAQVLALLTDKEYAAISAVAVYDNHRDAAACIGIKEPLLKYYLGNARKKIKRHWYAPDTAPIRPWGPNATTCRSGHSRAEHGAIEQGRWVCRLCHRNALRRRVAGLSNAAEVVAMREG